MKLVINALSTFKYNNRNYKIKVDTKGGIIGRAKVNNIRIPDDEVSRSHARINFNENTRRFSIMDLDSLSGTFIKSEK